MTHRFDRRLFLGSSAAAGMLLTLPAGAQSPLDVTFTGFPDNSTTVADCNVLLDEINRVVQDIEVINSASDTALEQQITAIMAALDVNKGQLSMAIGDVQKAIDSNVDKIEANAINAFRATNDLILATAVQSRNPNFIGAAVGVHILAGTGLFAYQIINAPLQSSKVEKAVVTLVKGRKQMYVIFKSGPGAGLAKKQVKMAGSLIKSVARIAQGAYNVSQLKSDLQVLQSDLTALDKNSVGLPVNSTETRPYFRARLEAELELYQLIRGALTPSNCLISTPVIVNPLA